MTATPVKTVRFLEHPVLAELGQWSWLLLCALLPISGGLVPVPLAIAVLLLLVPALIRRQRIELRSLWPLFAFYALHVLGMAWSSDMAFGLFDLQIKLGLVLLPLAAVVVTSLRSDALHRSMLAFTAGTLVAVGLSLWKAWNCYTASGDPGCFAQSTFSYSLHPSYAAWYACWAMAYWGHVLITGGVPGKRLRLALAVVLVVLVAFIMMLASKSGVIGLGVVLVVLLVSLVMRFRGRVRAVVLGIAMSALGLSAWLQGPLVLARMKVAWDAVELASTGKEEIYSATGGSEMRLVAWTCSTELLGRHPMGVGTGDIKHALVECYTSHHAGPALERRLNSHSQFLQAGVALGWPGVVAMLLLVLIPLVFGLRTGRLSLVLFMVLFLLNATVESVLEVQAGVVFFGIFLGLLINARTSQFASPATPADTRS